MKINFTSTASTSATAKKIKKTILANFRQIEWTEELAVTEGQERCGYGNLRVIGAFAAFNGRQTICYELANLGSHWKNFGHPTGTKHVVEIEINAVSVIAPSY